MINLRYDEEFKKILGFNCLFMFPKGLFQPEKGHKFSIDSLLLSCFVNPKPKDRIVDIGCGCGVISFGILLRNMDKDLEVVGIDFDTSMIECATKNAYKLGLHDIFRPILMDIVKVKEARTLAPEQFNIAVMNPPYRNLGSGRISPYSLKNKARFEQMALLEDFIKAAKYLVKNRGRLYLVYLCERMSYLFEVLKKYRFEPKRIRFIHGHKQNPSKVFLLEAVKNGSPSLIVEPPLIQYKSKVKENIFTSETLSFCPYVSLSLSK